MIDYIRLGIAAGALAVAATGGAAAAWAWQDNAWTAKLASAQTAHESTLGEIARAGAQQLRQQQERYAEQQARLNEQDKQHHEELTNVQKANVRLAVDLAAAEQRLSVRIADPAASASGVLAGTGAAGVDNGTGARADIHPATAAALVRVTGRADECRVRLTALQLWVVELLAR
jgi:hypothetical protein